jgi:hypothetical protein
MICSSFSGATTHAAYPSRTLPRAAVRDRDLDSSARLHRRDRLGLRPLLDSASRPEARQRRSADRPAAHPRPRPTRLVPTRREPDDR